MKSVSALLGKGERRENRKIKGDQEESSSIQQTDTFKTHDPFKCHAAYLIEQRNTFPR